MLVTTRAEDRGAHRRILPNASNNNLQPHLLPVVQHRVEALQHGLAGQVQLVQQHPGAPPQRLQQRAVTPSLVPKIR